MLKRFIDIFRIRSGERKECLIALVWFMALNLVSIVTYWEKLHVVTGNYRKLFVSKYHVSGFDPLTYVVVSDWDTSYNVYRHPLLAFFFWPLSMTNKALISVTGMNWALPLMGVVLTVCGTYSFLFLRRILHDVVGLGQRDSNLLCAFFFSFGYIMLSVMVPDHFVMSMTCLSLALWLAGEKLKRGSAMNLWQTIGLFLLTAGVSLNNGLKIFLMAMVTRRRRFLEWRYLLLGVVLPALLLWYFARWEYRQFVLPNELARKEIKARKNKEYVEKIRREVKDSLQNSRASALSVEKGAGVAADSVLIETNVERIQRERAKAKYKRDSQKIWNVNKGKPFMEGEFMGWTDKSTPRWRSIVENVFGEAIQLHRDYALGDALRNRPAIVNYSGYWRYVNYGVEALIAVLFLVGIWMGRRQLFLWTVMSCFLMDMVLHLGLGFGLNEVYIMTAHYMFAVPIAVAYVLKHFKKERILLRAAITVVTLFLLIWNGSIILHCI